VIGHFVWFVATSARNRLRTQLRRLRSLRYASAALVGVLYFVFLFGDWAREPGDDATVGELYVEVARRLGPLAIGLMAAWWWLWGGHRNGLVLSPAETHLLVPAPLTRSALIRFKVLQAQATILLSAGLATLLTRGSALPWPLRLLSLWTLLATLHQHQVAASLVHAAAEEQGRRGLRRVWPAVLLFTAAFAGVAWSVWQALRDIMATGVASAAPRLAALMEEPVPRIALAPFRLILEPLVATSASTWAAPFALAVLVLAAHYLWLQRTDAAFEEAAAAEGAARDARALAAKAGSGQGSLTRRKGRLAPALLPLNAAGRPAYAIYWKNLLYVQRLVRPTTVLVLLFAVAAMASPAILAASDPAAMAGNAGFVLLFLAGLLTAAGPFAVRNDLRLDLGHLPALRSLPLRGREVVAAEIAAATTVVALLQCIFAVGGLLLLLLAGRLSPLYAVAGMAAAPLLLPPLAALGVTVHNALALLYPGWIRVGSHEGGGVESIGQNLVTLTASLLLMIVALVPPLVAAAAVAAPALALSLPAAIAAGAFALAAAILLEIRLLILWLGRLYDRTDPVTAGLME
jgi:ABC-2 type transport system permease protein